MGWVVALSSHGLSPQLIASVERMQDEIWDAIDKAALAGIPAGLLVGQLEFIKAALIEHNFRSSEQEGA
ncbi:hypothetical protein A9C11_10940 [Pseudomonas citronellolis]|uniref:Uncharacterized protein n=2 Tax=Pseudomonas citronellolis TaxID=53408 RepID=A0A1A9K9L0_9PSED|nr:hypothetical protein A9C11_10940 [Pseudomonas citronellolis]